VSGPDINRFQSGSNAIGSFTIGVSPIGDISGFDFWKTIISQYANSAVLTTLIDNFNQCIDPTLNLQSFFDLIWNVDTAQGYGLDVWGRIVGVIRTLQIVGTQTYFDFQEAGLSANGFGQQSFFTDGQQLTTNFALSDDAFRVLILAKAFANISDGSIKSLNQLLVSLFPHRGNAFVTDGLNMSMTYSFTFTLTPVELAILSQSGVLPKPTGVSLTIVQV
jgi:hypothetical protein